MITQSGMTLLYSLLTIFSLALLMTLGVYAQDNCLTFSQSTLQKVDHTCGNKSGNRHLPARRFGSPTPAYAVKGKNQPGTSHASQNVQGNLHPVPQGNSWAKGNTQLRTNSVGRNTISKGSTPKVVQPGTTKHTHS